VVTDNQPDKVIKHRYSLGDDPRYGPEDSHDSYPRTHSNPVTLVNTTGSSKHAQIDGFGGDVAVDYTCDDDL
jgi:hypothetical protein